MSRNHEVLKPHLLLDASGELAEPGWSRSLIQKYDRGMIKAPGWRIKEWDYYLVMNDQFAGAFTISDDGYIGLQSVSLLIFGEKPWEHTETVLNTFPMGRLKMPSDSSAGVTKYRDRRLQMRFAVELPEENKRVTIVKTGDEFKLVPLYIAMVVSGLVFLYFALDALTDRIYGVHGKR